MKQRVLTAIVGLMLVSIGVLNAQFKSQVDQQTNVANGMIREDASSLIFGWFNPASFHMRHSLNMSYQTFGGQGFSLGTYTNSMLYEFADNLNARADVSFSFSPYSSLPGLKKNDFSNVYLSRAELNYKPWDNVFMKVQFRQIPNGFGYGYYSPFYNPWYREDGF